MPTIRYRHIIWDWNGTLIDDVAVCVRVLNLILDQYGLPSITIERYRREFCFPVERFYQNLSFDFARSPYQQIADQYIELYKAFQQQCRLHTGAVDVLQWSKRLGIGQSILSAYKQGLLEEAVKRFGIADYFAMVVGNTDHLAIGKIDQGRSLLGGLGLDPSQVVLIGDTTHDYQVASSIGVECLLFCQGHQDPSRLRSCPVPVLTSLKQIPGFIAGL
ncbi:MAG: HAD family hydrolase [Sedimentisphaerales bacterium]|nr:HAD family hydrolase [Sedimentisphaerales bacterium]